ncbi:patatin-like phospholipase domain-containing protein 4 isoform X2 [Panthera pardus]|uniref:Patatin-like phospholipase domain-containing protein 4 isoform X2 n=1 Tax=Panthera pardus TaxID=9691 RepID=A0A9W2UN15_PANPR|nr:patatin-like phospholipase domain-containing protein 4 isoform X2 [Panthera pardus]
MPAEQVERGAEEQPGGRPQRRPWTPPFGPAGPPLKGKGEKRGKTTSGGQPRRGPSTSARMKHINLSFAACGFLGIYHLGAASALYRHGRKLLKDVKAFAGASAGSLVATVLLTAPERIEECNEFTYKFAEEIRRQSFGALTPGYDFMARLRSGMDLILPANAHELAHNRLHVSITNTKTRQNYLVSKFSSREDLIKKWVDGGLTNSLPILPVGRTVTVSPFSGRLDISPQDKGQLNVYVNVAKQDMMLSVANLVRLNQALFPPSKRKMESLYQHGFGDAIKFLLKENWFE